MRRTLVLAALLTGCSKPAVQAAPPPPEPDCGLGAHAKNGRCEAIDAPCRPGETLIAGKGCVGPEPSAQPPPAANARARRLAPELTAEDLVVGEGDPVVPPARVRVHYVGRLPGGATFDDSHPRGPFAFELGRGHVIRGWELGVEGMRIGGVRKLTIGPSLAYGDRGIPPNIPPRSTLEFEIELLSVDR